MTDMRYMDHLEVVAADAVGLIREKTGTYGDSWKRRGGPGAWFTIVRPIDRLEGIAAKFGGDIFEAVRHHPSGDDGTALACVRDIMNYCILIEAHARAALGVGPHGPARKAEPERCECCKAVIVPERRWQFSERQDIAFCSEGCGEHFFGEVRAALPRHRPGTPEDGGHHALEPAGEVTQDTAGAGGSAGRASAGDRLEAFRVEVAGLAEEYGLPAEFRTTALGNMVVVEIDLRKLR